MRLVKNRDVEQIARLVRDAHINVEAVHINAALMDAFDIIIRRFIAKNAVTVSIRDIELVKTIDIGFGRTNAFLLGVVLDRNDGIGQ